MTSMVLFPGQPPPEPSWDCEIVSSTSSTGGWHYLLLHDIKTDYQEVVNNIVTNDHNTMRFELDKQLASTCV